MLVGYFDSAESESEHFYQHDGKLYLTGYGGSYGADGKLFEFVAGQRPTPWKELPWGESFNLNPSDEITESQFDQMTQPPSGPLAARAFASSAASRVVYVSDLNTNSVFAIDGSSGAQVAKATLSGIPSGLALSPDGATLYAIARASYQQPDRPNYLAMIDTSTLQVTNIPLPEMSFPNWVAVSPDGNTVYVSAEGFYQVVGGKDQTVVQSAVYAVDPVKRAVTATLALPSQMGQGGRYGRLAISPDGSTLVVNDQSKLIVVDTLTFTISKSIDSNGLPAGPHMLFSPDGTRFYFPGYILDGNPFTGNQPIAVLDAQTWTKFKYFSAGAASEKFSVGDVALSVDGSTLAVANTADESVNLYDSTTGQLITSFPGNGHPVESMFLAAGY